MFEDAEIIQLDLQNFGLHVRQNLQLTCAKIITAQRQAQIEKNFNAVSAQEKQIFLWGYTEIKFSRVKTLKNEPLPKKKKDKIVHVNKKFSLRLD